MFIFLYIMYFYLQEAAATGTSTCWSLVSTTSVCICKFAPSRLAPKFERRCIYVVTRASTWRGLRQLFFFPPFLSFVPPIFPLSMSTIPDRLSTVRFGSGSAILGLNLNLNIRFGSLRARTPNQTSGSRFKVRTRFGFPKGKFLQKPHFSGLFSKPRCVKVFNLLLYD